MADQDELDFDPDAPSDAPGTGSGATKSGHGATGIRGFAAPHGPHSCNGCKAVWTGARTAHCAAVGCHRTFATVGLFDAHRAAVGDHGACRDPATLTRAGSRVMFDRDGMWRAPEMSVEQKLAAFGDRPGTTG